MRFMQWVIGTFGGLYRLAAFTLAVSGVATLLVLFLGIRHGQPVPHHPRIHHHVQVTAAALPKYHWPGGRLILYLLGIDLVAFIILRMCGGILSGAMSWGYDNANVRAVGQGKWSNGQIDRYTSIYRRYKK